MKTALIPRKEVLATARAYRTEAEFFPDMGHNMMLEPGWAAVAERIHTWLGTHRLWVRPSVTEDVDISNLPPP